MNGTVFDIQRFAIHDGPGIRTVVFLKGCPLHCLWCHNPESQQSGPEIFFSPEKCIACRACEPVCPNGCHQFPDHRHIYRRERCAACGSCAAQCCAEALELIGETREAVDILYEVAKDTDFYRKSGGGLTLSGGEPMMQFAFTRSLLTGARETGTHTCIETCGWASFERFGELLPLVDLFLYDIKEMDPTRHEQYTGVSNRRILENLRALDRAGAAIILRCPVIPGLNDRPDHFAGIAALAESLLNLQEVHVLPYHELGTSKSARLGKTPALCDVPMPEPAQAQGWVEAIQKDMHIPVRIG